MLCPHEYRVINFQVFDLNGANSDVMHFQKRFKSGIFIVLTGFIWYLASPGKVILSWLMTNFNI